MNKKIVSILLKFLLKIFYEPMFIVQAAIRQNFEFLRICCRKPTGFMLYSPG
ncbi:MAG: hypothetical protein JWP12_487 [Bacteroidetes bacterium]|nr:hypothetical protein [Bacteroidota bacterium]